MILILMQQRMQDDMMDLMDYSSEIQDSLGRSYGVPEDIDEEDLMGGKSPPLFFESIESAAASLSSDYDFPMCADRDNAPKIQY